MKTINENVPYSLILCFYTSSLHKNINVARKSRIFTVLNNNTDLVQSSLLKLCDDGCIIIVCSFRYDKRWKYQYLLDSSNGWQSFLVYFHGKIECDKKLAFFFPSRGTSYTMFSRFFGRAVFLKKANDNLVEFININIHDLQNWRWTSVKFNP